MGWSLRAGSQAFPQVGTLAGAVPLFPNTVLVKHFKTLLLWLICLAPLLAQQMVLPSTSIPLSTSEGQQLLLESQHKTAYWPLSMHYEAQENHSFCGPASSVMILNSMQSLEAPLSLTHAPFHEFQQDNFFTAETEKILPRSRLLQRGATLDQLAGMLREHGVQAEAVHARDGQLDRFRQSAGEALGKKDHFVIINFARAPLEQTGGTHFSPLAAYHAGSDRFLVMDVARFRYPPFWVKTEDLFRSMNTVDSDSGDTRGYILVWKP